MQATPLILGVRNSGNRALRRALGLATHKHPNDPKLKTRLKKQSHIVVPLRDPYSVAVSWYRRNNWPHPSLLIREFRALDEWIQYADSVHFVCMDRLDIRAQQIHEVVERFQLHESLLEPPPVRPLMIPPAVLAAIYQFAEPAYSLDCVARFYLPHVGLEPIEYNTDANEVRRSNGIAFTSIEDADTGEQKLKSRGELIQ